MPPRVQATDFFNLWVSACNARHPELFADWYNCPLFTSHVFTDDRPIIKTVAAHLDLIAYSGYYSLDAILFSRQDLIPSIPAGTTWMRQIRIAFEHENNFGSGLFQEVGHLLITDCDLRVVVSYPLEHDDTQGDLRRELDYQHQIISGVDRAQQISSDGSFLFIVGWLDAARGTIEWRGYVYELASWRIIGSSVYPPPSGNPNIPLNPAVP